MQQIIARDHYPEIVENGKGMRRLEALGIHEELREPSHRRDFFASLTDSQFKHMTGYINSITQGKKVEYDYADGKFTDGFTPPPEDKEPLMRLAFKTVREIASNRELDDKTALRRAGLAMAGALNYIHAYEEGNGRTSRVMQYLIEFGTERGNEAVNEELYALIGKLPVYDTDDKLAIDNTPHPALDRALNAKVREQNPNSIAEFTPREFASARVTAFLDMMRGAHVPINERVVMGRVKREGGYAVTFAEPGELSGIEFTEKQYLRSSAIPNRLPSEVPPEAHRVMARKPEAVAAEAGSLTLRDFMQEVIE